MLFTQGTYIHTLINVLFQNKTENLFPVVYDSSHLRFYLADFLWAFSLTALLNALYLPNTKGKIFICLTVCIVGILWESLQFCSIAPGTGDSVDVLVYILAALAVTIIKFKGE